MTKQLQNINTVINEALKGKDASDIYAVDAAMKAADGTKDKSNLGSKCNSGAVSIASCRAAATALEIPLYRFLGGVNANRLPGTDDEHRKRRMSCIIFRTGCTGIYDHAGWGTFL